VRVMIAPEKLASVALLVHRRAPELPAPDHQRLVKQALCFRF
jgi:hypothetical protein